ncbi:3-methyl-2-oxobutanoate hydroxymethyltransferase [Marinicrinis lubricantis]|uniref:3-methyl-2-oxobutanoate hydroxymethyltransferase n=1 Tax=Marinicrinis lubricantis TaxID=2086470 RepID=A0ABW1IM19_9BACL
MDEKRKMLSVTDFRKMKKEGSKIAMVTAYDYPAAKLSEKAGADMLLVGDSLGMVVLGYESTIPVTIEDMLHHTKAVTRGAPNTFVVTDMPFLSYHGNIDTTMKNAARLMQEGLCRALKLEGGAEIASTVSALVKAGIPIVGHIGLTPQAVHQLGGYRVQGKDTAQAEKLLSDAVSLEQAGAFAVVLEMVPEELAQWISSRISIPTIGIGAGRYCDGQVLVYHDLLQYASPLKPKFVKSYAELGQHVTEAVHSYVTEVKAGQFPAEEHVFHLNETVSADLKHKLK